MAEKSYRIKASVGQEQVIKTSLTQDIDFLEVLSLKLNQKDTYKLHVSNYGIIVGRILANEAFGIPNAKVSVFIKLNDDDLENSEIANLYPYRSIMTTNNDNKRYNLLSDSSNDDCYRIVGTFPNKRLVLDNDTEIEIYDKYWKYTTVTNQSGDYMIFGVPTGNQTIHVDIDLSDIGILSQKPRDFFYKGYNKEQFDSAEQFKEGSDLDNLTQLLSQNTSVHVFPFFGDKSENDIAITRCDIKVPYKFEPTCVFIGSIISDKKGQHIGHACGPSKKVGFNSNLTTGEGTIEMIRQTPDGLIEEFPIKANRLIDGDGVWCYQIPMNLDYIGTDEFGNIIPVQDSTKGIPTRTSVRFRISMQETISAPSTEHVAKHLVPSVHELDSQTNEPHILNGSLYDNCYEFGSATPKEYFRDLLWNKVYSVKSFIPRFEHKNKSGKNYMGIRSVNDGTNKNNIFPFNSARFQLKFTYRVLCLILTIVVDIIGFYNKFISELLCLKLPLIGRPFKFLTKYVKCIGIKGSELFEEDMVYYFPKCDKACGSILEPGNLKVDKSKDALKDRVQQALSLEYELVNLDFHNDWINGTLYFPLWFWRKRAKKKYFFGLFSKKAVNTFCSCDKTYNSLKLTQGCGVNYDASFQPIKVSSTETKYHKKYDERYVKYGVIKEFTNRDGLNIYYYSPGSPNDLNYKTNRGLTSFSQLFATDIILLGSLNSCDLDNLPKTFDSLPSTTVNVPFIATFESDETGDGIVTGLDWEHDGEDYPIKYQKGLLIDLKCWTVNTRYKSCVNLSRLSELHVTFDMDMTQDDINEPNITHDGLITEKELVEHETRAKFASLNHNGLTNLVKNPTTNYDTYKFHYVYPVNFDGHLESVRVNYSASKTFSDISDSNYIMYRLGEGKDSSSNLRHKKHFYNGEEKNFSFPLYNNSFYFYFGLNEGNTAIDKFNTQYNALCTKRNNFSFTIEYNAKAGKWCYNTENIATDFGTIDIEFEGLTDMFSYVLYNEFNEIVVSEENVVSNELKFGYDIKVGGGSYIMTNDGYKKDGRIKEFKTGNIVTNSFGKPKFLENGIYYLEVTNSFGMKVTQKINMIQNTLSPNIEGIKLGTKYIQGKTVASDICGEMDFYGEIRIKSITIDGEEAYIQSIDTYYLDGVDHYYVIDDMTIYPIDGIVDYDGVNYLEIYNEEDDKWTVTLNNETYDSIAYEQPKEVTCKVKCTDGSQVYLILEPENDETQDISNFVCYGVGNIQTARLEQQGLKDGLEIFTLIFNIWKPGDYVLTSNQICNNVMNDNISVNTISIENGEKFQAYLNGIPFKMFENDYVKGNLIPYAENLNSISVSDTFPRMWLQLENPQVYDFHGTQIKDVDFWDDFIEISTNTKTDDNDNNITYVGIGSKIEILKHQIKTISETCNMAYIMGENSIPQITITTKGGKEPILIRNIHPNYNELDEENYVSDSILIENNNTLQAPLLFPYIVDEFYQNTTMLKHGDGIDNIRLNKLVYPVDSSKLGNYFAVFTNNGGMVNLINDESKYDSSLYVESSPNGAKSITSLPAINTIKTKQYPKPIFLKNGEYIRTMFVDKRLTYTGEFYVPITCKYKVYDEDDTQWKYGKLPLKIFNGVPLIYDDEYNIIGKNLSYEFKRVMDDITVETIEPHSEINKNTKATIFYKIEGETYTLTFKNKSYFNGIDDNFSTINVITGKSYDEILVKIRTICDNIATNINYTYNSNNSSEISGLSFNKIVDIENASVFNDDSNIKLTSNLMWNSDLCAVARKKMLYRKKGRLYKCYFSVDDVETDIRDKFEYYNYGSEICGTSKHMSFLTTSTDIIVPFGSVFTLEASNCKMIGDLTYETEKDENEVEHYVFKTNVQEGDTMSTSLDIGQRINVKSGVLFYEPINSGKYFVHNGQKLYLGDAKIRQHEKYYCFSEYNYVNNVISGYTMYLFYNGEKCPITYDGTKNKVNNHVCGTMNGCIWYKKTMVYYYDDNDIQSSMNKYGVPIYCYFKGFNENEMYFCYTFNPYCMVNVINSDGSLTNDYTTLTWISSAVTDNNSNFTIINAGGYNYEESGTTFSVPSYKVIQFALKFLDSSNNVKYRKVYVPLSREELNSISHIPTSGLPINVSGYFYKYIKDDSNNMNKRAVLPATKIIEYDTNLKEILNEYFEEPSTYEVSNYIKKVSKTYVLLYYYFPINYDKTQNRLLLAENMFRASDLYDGKEIRLNIYEYDKMEINPDKITNGIIKPSFTVNGQEVTSFKMINYVFEKNELDGRFYLRELDLNNETKLDENGQPIYHKLYYLYRKYYSISAINTFFYEGEEDLEYQYGYVEKTKAHKDNVLTIDNIIANGSSSIYISNDPHISFNDSDTKYKAVTLTEIRFKKSGDTISYDDNLYKLKENVMSQFDISSVEDFSCTIETDTSNEDCDKISTDTPFLSCAISKNYMLKKVDTDLTFFDEIELSIPIWKKASNLGDNDVLNIDRYVDDFDNDVDILNMCVLNDEKYAIYNKKLYEYILYKPRYDAYGNLIDKQGNAIQNNGGSIHWTDVIEIYYVNTKKESIVQNNTQKTEEENTLLLENSSFKSSASEIFEKIVWEKITFAQYKSLIETETSRNYFAHRSIKKVASIPKYEIDLIARGNKNYYKGVFNIDNILKENNSDTVKRIGNTNIPYNIAGITSDADVELVRKYKTTSSTIGEIYPYFNQYTFGTLSNGLFEFGTNEIDSSDEEEDVNEETEKVTSFFPTNSLGHEYNGYLPIFKHHPFIDSCNVVYDIKKNIISTIKINKGQVNTFGFHSFRPTLNYQNIYESDENYDKLLYVFQPNTICDIPKGTKIISCNFAKKYEDSNTNFNYKLLSTFSQNTNFHVGPMYFGKSFDATISNEDGTYSLIKKIPMYIFDENINEDLKQLIEDNNFTYYFNHTKFTYNPNDDIRELVYPQLTYYANYDGEKFTKKIGVNTNASFINSRLLSELPKSLDDKYGKNLYFMPIDENSLEDTNIDNMVRPIIKFNYDFNSDKYNVSILDPYLINDNDINESEKIIASTKISKDKIESELSSITTTYNITKFTDNKYNIYYMDVNEDEDASGDYKEIVSGSTTVEETKITLRISIIIKTTFNGDVPYTCEKEIKQSSLSNNKYKWQTFCNSFNMFTDTVFFKLKLSSINNVNYVQFISGSTTYDLYDSNNVRISASTTTGVNDMTLNGPYRINNSKMYYTLVNDTLYAKNGTTNTGTTPGIGGGDRVEGDLGDDSGSSDSGGDLDLSQGGGSVIDPLNPINPLSETDEPSVITDEETEEEVVETVEDTFRKAVMNLSANTTSGYSEILLYDYRVDGYPVKVVNTRSANITKPGISIKPRTTDLKLNFLAFKSKLFKENEGYNFNVSIQKKGCVYQNYIGFNNYNLMTNPNIKISNILELSDITDDFVLTDETEYKTIVIPYAVAEASEQKLLQLTCNDGYTINGSQYDKITCVNSNGDKVDYTLNDILTKGAIGQYIYHVETIDDVSYDFISQISNVKTVGSAHLLTVTDDNISERQNVVLTIESNNLMHKFPFHYKNGDFLVGFYDKHLNEDDKSIKDDIPNTGSTTGGTGSGTGGTGSDTGSTESSGFSLTIYCKIKKERKWIDNNFVITGLTSTKQFSSWSKIITLYNKQRTNKDEAMASHNLDSYNWTWPERYVMFYIKKSDKYAYEYRLSLDKNETFTSKSKVNVTSSIRKRETDNGYETKQTYYLYYYDTEWFNWDKFNDDYT